ncbi:MAG: TonB-dependent receptor [Cytophagaceae bacterium]|nr:TonB-dependent receptor [Cytophagaceae bacterium]MBL0303885.1 TonB-dependent receptor [Cytophagaceae bacterium]MBL0326699.1 TonB-dependent receptor [Cytophagaceae bacterium]
MLQKAYILLKFILVFTLFYQDISAQKLDCECFVVGKIKDAQTGEPVSGALVEIKSLRKAVFADNLGEYRIDNICEGRYLISVKILGFEEKTQWVDLKHEFHWEVALEESEIHLDQVNIVARKVETINSNLKSISEEIIKQKSGNLLGEILKELPGVNTMSTGSNIVKPVIHGLHSNRIMTINNGIKHEGQQWGNEHAPEIDPFLAKKITVIKGASSVRYGPEAIGGVILVEPAEMVHREKLLTEINQFSMSNGWQNGISLITEGSLHKIKDLNWRVQVSTKKGGNISTPQYSLANTGSQEFNFSLAGKYSFRKIDNELFFSQFNTKIAIFSGAHIGNLTDLSSAINRARPLEIYTPETFTYKLDRPFQDIQHNLLKIKSAISLKNNQNVSFTFGNQYNFRSEVDALRGDKSTAQIFKITTQSLETIFQHKPIFKKLNGNLGLNTSIQKNITTGTLKNPLKSNVLIPNFLSKNIGLFLTERFVKSRFEWEGGIRLDTRIMDVFYLKRGENEITAENFFNYRFSASSSMNKIISPNFKFGYNIGTAWKPPVVSELFSDGVHHGAASYEVGDRNLTSEKSVDNALTIEFEAGYYHFESQFYVNFIQDYIFMAPTGNGVLTIRGAFPEFKYTQTDALFKGFDLSNRLNFTKNIVFENHLSFLRADDLERRQPLIFIPANRSVSSISIELPLKLLEKIKISHQFVAKQKRVPTKSVFENEENSEFQLIGGDYSASPPSYNLIDLYLSKSYLFKNKSKINCGLEIKNLTNTVYRDYLNRFRYFTSDQGINFILRMNLTF